MWPAAGTSQLTPAFGSTYLEARPTSTRTFFTALRMREGARQAFLSALCKMRASFYLLLPVSSLYCTCNTHTRARSQLLFRTRNQGRERGKGIIRSRDVSGSSPSPQYPHRRGKVRSGPVKAPVVSLIKAAQSYTELR